MRTKKFELRSLSIKSFTTSVKEVNSETIKGGAQNAKAVNGGFPGFSECCSYLHECMPSYSPGCYTVDVKDVPK